MVPVFEIYEKTRPFMLVPLNSEVKRLTFRTLCVSMIALAAMGVPKFGLFLNLTGACACAALAFYFPIRMYNIIHTDLSKYWKIVHYLILILGVLAGSISFFISFIALLNAFTEEHAHKDII